MNDTPDEDYSDFNSEDPGSTGFRAIPLSALPEALKNAMEQSRGQDDVNAKVRTIVKKKDGLIEARLLPEFSHALQNDMRITNADALRAQHVAQKILDRVHKDTRRASYWASAHLLRFVSAVMTLEAQAQQEAGLLQEDKFPGSTTAVADLSLPGEE